MPIVIIITVKKKGEAGSVVSSSLVLLAFDSHPLQMYKVFFVFSITATRKPAQNRKEKEPINLPP